MSRCVQILIFLYNVKCLILAEPMWPKAVETVAIRYFPRPVILILDATNITNQSDRSLIPKEYWDGKSDAIGRLDSKWSILCGDLNYQKPEGGFVHFTLGLTRAHQIVAIINETTAINSKVFEKIILLWRQHVLWFSRGKILLVVEAPKNLSMKIANVVFGELWRQIKSVNVALIVCHGEQGTFLSWEPYSKNCNVEPYVAGYWESEKNYSFTIFPTYDFNNLHQCKLLAVPVVLEPFVFAPDKHNHYHEGIEVKIFLALADYLNFSYGYVPIPAGESAWSTMTKDNVPGGLIGVLYRREADISLSGTRLTFDRSEICDHVDSYYGDDYSWIGPTARRTARWKAIFLVFTWKIWTCICFALIGSLSLLTAIYYYFDYEKPKKGFLSAFLVVWAITMGSSIPKLYYTSHYLIRGFLAVLLFYVLTLNSIYVSTLFKVLSKGLKQEPVHSAEEALDAGITASVFPSNYLEIHEALPKFLHHATANNLIIWEEDYLSCFRKAAITSNCFTLYPKLGAKYFINMLFTSLSGRNYVRVFEDRFKSYEPVLYMSKHHPLLPVFRMKVKRLVESGLVLKEIDKIMTSAWLKRAALSEVGELAENEVQTVLSVEQIMGAFLVSSILLIFAIVAFLVEICSTRKGTIKIYKIVKRWKEARRINQSEMLRDRIECRLDFPEK